MNTMNFGNTGGFPFSTRILDELQTAFSIFNALGAIAGDKTIISGCVTTGSIVSPGVVCIGGEVLEFKGGTAQAKVKIIEAIESLLFEDNVSKPVIRYRYVQFGTGGGALDWADFKRPLETKTLEAILQVVNNSFDTIFEKLNTIEHNAKVQVQSDFNQSDNTKKDFIKNKPQTISYLYKGTFAIGDNPAVDSLITINFPNVGTNNYMVVGSMVSVSSNYNLDNDVFWMIREKSNTSFKITLREVSNNLQDLIFEYLLIPL